MIDFLGLICFIFLFAQGAEPIQDIKRYFNLGTDSDFKNKVQWFFLKLLNCCLCIGFWFGLFFYQDLLSASLVSISAELLYRLLNRI